MSPLAFPPTAYLGGRYRPIAHIANGGMGQVVEAHDERLDRAVAVKLVATTEPEQTDRLRAEARALAQLRHPNVVDVYDVGEHEGRAFVVTELIRGESLHALLRREGPLPLGAVARLGADIAAALACAHAHGIVHRDLKPGNVLIERERGRAQLIDFGIAASTHAAGLTGTGTVVGTPAYLSPEQVEGTRATPAADVYALGLVLLEAATGRAAFPGTTTETVAARLTRAPEIPDALGPRWRWLLGAMTRREPERRPSGADLAALLEALAAEGSRPAAIVGDEPDAGAPLVAVSSADTAASPHDGVGPPTVETRRRLAQRSRPRTVAALVAAVLVGVVALGATALDGSDTTPAVDVDDAAPPTTTADTTPPAAAPAPVEAQPAHVATTVPVTAPVEPTPPETTAAPETGPPADIAERRSATKKDGAGPPADIEQRRASRGPDR